MNTEQRDLFDVVPAAAKKRGGRIPAPVRTADDVVNAIRQLIELTGYGVDGRDLEKALNTSLHRAAEAINEADAQRRICYDVDGYNLLPPLDTRGRAMADARELVRTLDIEPEEFRRALFDFLRRLGADHQRVAQ